MAKTELSGQEIAALINAGWTPPKRDYDEWRPALAAFQRARGYVNDAERILNLDRPLFESDNREIDFLAAALTDAPKSDV